MPIDFTKPTKAPAPVSADTSAPCAAAPTPAPAGKVTLTKQAPAVALTGQGSAAGLLRVNLNWNTRPAGQGGFGTSPAGGGSIDLDLACLYEYADGSKGVVQALGNLFRDVHRFGPDPICWLDGDDRSGTKTGGENLFVNLAHVAAIKRILVFAFIYQGVPNWAAADAVVTLHPATGPQVEVRLDEHAAQSPMCAIALLENVAGELSVRREVRYFRGSHPEIDSAYGWGMRWAQGSK